MDISYSSSSISSKTVDGVYWKNKGKKEGEIKTTKSFRVSKIKKRSLKPESAQRVSRALCHSTLQTSVHDLKYGCDFY